MFGYWYSVVHALPNRKCFGTVILRYLLEWGRMGKKLCVCPFSSRSDTKAVLRYGMRLFAKCC
jgi:hypothetical protein